MKKLLSFVLSAFMMLSVSSCSFSGVKEVVNGGYYYEVNQLKIRERDFFAPCYFSEFFNGNEHIKQYFAKWLNVAHYHKDMGLVVTIDGEEWSMVERVSNKLPQGNYKIVIETVSGLRIREETDSGIVERPYRKKITIPVSVSDLYEDKYSINV